MSNATEDRLTSVSGCQVGYAYNNAGNITSFEGAALTYTDLAHRHAVTHLAGTQKYWYDANGNMTRRINFSLDVNYSYDAENHLTGVSGGKTATFVYDGDGNLVKTTVGSVTVAIAGDHYQYSGTTGTKHYFANGVRFAERVGGGLTWLLTDHLGSTSVTTDQYGAYLTELRYYPYGKPRYNPGGQTTDYRFTGQRWQGDIGLYYYGARWYDHLIGRFAQPDTVAPEPDNPQSLNRYSYVLNNPLKYSDPTGNRECDLKCQQEQEWTDPIRIHEGEWYMGSCWGARDCIYPGIVNTIVPDKGTKSIGLTGSLGALVFGTVSLGIVHVDANGDVAIGSLSIGGGAVDLATEDVSFYYMTTNGPSVDSLAGWNVPIGASIAGLVLSAGEEWTFGKDPKTDELVVGHVLTLGQGGNLGAPLPPAEVHVGVTRTWLLPNRHNLFDMFSLSRPKVR